MLGRRAVQVGADRDRAVGEGAAQPELEAGAHVVGRPVGFAIGAHRRERRVEGAVGIGGARPDVTLVQVRVQVDQPRPDLAAVLVDQGRACRRGRAPRRAHSHDTAVLDVEIDQRQLIAGIGEVAIQQAERHARVGDAQLGAFDQSQRSRRTALSCQRLSTRCASRVNARKIRTPVSEIRTTAANMRGMLSR
jgi:hypothetical protein